MALSKQYTQRIDSFLERLGCDYIDIRFEMVDHLASEIEEKVSNYDVFFYKDKMQGKFLGFMMTRKKGLLDNYNRQAKKLFWSNFGYIFKLIAKELMTIKILLFIALVVIFFKYLMQFNIFYAAISAISIVIISASYFFFIQNKEVKKYGKLRLLFTFYWLSYLPLIIINPFYNFKLILENKDDHNIFMIYFCVIYFIFNTILTLVFIKDRTFFRKKYKRLFN